MEGSFTYSRQEAEQAILKQHRELIPAPNGMTWMVEPPKYGCGEVAVRLVAVEHEARETQ